MRVAALIVIALYARVASAGGQASPDSPPASQEPACFVALPPAQGVAAATTQPVAVRGGVLLLPLERRSALVEWPSTLTLALDDGRTLAGTVVSIERHEPTDAGWTTPRFIERTTPPTGDGAVALLAVLPTDGADGMLLGDQRIEPLWLDPLPIKREARALAPDQLPSRDDSPDARAPNERFRALLQAHRLGTQPVPLAIEGADGLLARAYAGLWSAALARLEEQDPLVAEDLLSDLVGRARGMCRGATRSVAAWETNDDELAQLLRSLLAPEVPGVVLVESARAWLDGRCPLTIWVVAEDGDALTLGVANPRSRSVDLELAWPRLTGLAFDGAVAPESIELIRVTRPAFDDDDPAGLEPAVAQAIHDHGLGRLLPPADAAPDDSARSALERQARAPRVLVARTGAVQLSMLVGSGMIAARPPGVGTGLFSPTATLAQVRSGLATPVPDGWSTSLGLRRRPNGWEVIVECRQAAPDAVLSDELTVTLDAGFAHTLVIASTGVVRAASEQVEGKAAFAHNPFNWRARVPIPDSWLGSAENFGRISLTAARRIEPKPGEVIPLAARVQHAGFAAPSFDPVARAIPMDLSGWSPSSVTLSP